MSERDNMHRHSLLYTALGVVLNTLTEWKKKHTTSKKAENEKNSFISLSWSSQVSWISRIGSVVSLRRNLFLSKILKVWCVAVKKIIKVLNQSNCFLWLWFFIKLISNQIRIQTQQKKKSISSYHRHMKRINSNCMSVKFSGWKFNIFPFEE